MSIIVELSASIGASIVTVVVAWKFRDIVQNNDLINSLRVLISSKGIKDIGDAYIIVLNLLLDDSMVGNKYLKTFAIYINASLFKSLVVISEKIVSAPKNEKKSNTIVGMMISKKMKNSSKAQSILFLSLLINLASSLIIDSQVNGLLCVLIAFLLLCIQLDHKLIEYRIGKGLYGKNAFEAKEIIEFIIAHADKDDFNDSGGLKKVIPQPNLDDIKVRSENIGGAVV
jgi:hypothetical protein